MKKYAPHILIVSLMLVLAFVKYDCLNHDKFSNEDLMITEEILTLSERVDLIAHVPSIDLYDGNDDDESNILYTGYDVGDVFSVEDFTEFDENPSKETIRKIREIHIPELQKVRDNTGKTLVIRSASRSLEWEKKEAGQVNRNISTKED